MQAVVLVVLSNSAVIAVPFYVDAVTISHALKNVISYNKIILSRERDWKCVNFFDCVISKYILSFALLLW